MDDQFKVIGEGEKQDFSIVPLVFFLKQNLAGEVALFLPLNKPGYGGMSIKERRRAGIWIYCESVRQRKDPYPKRRTESAKLESDRCFLKGALSCTAVKK